MTTPDFPFREFEPPLPPVTWRLATVLALQTDPEAVGRLRVAMREACNGDLEIVATADEALDMIGGASRPFDLILLGCEDELLGHSAHVMSVLRKHLIPSVVLATSRGEVPDNASWPWFVGIADWLDLDERRWPRRVAQAIDAGATLARIIGRAQVPWHMDEPVAEQLYSAQPGTPFIVPPNE